MKHDIPQTILLHLERIHDDGSLKDAIATAIAKIGDTKENNPLLWDSSALVDHEDVVRAKSALEGDSTEAVIDAYNSRVFAGSKIVSYICHILFLSLGESSTPLTKKFLTDTVDVMKDLYTTQVELG